MVEVPWQITELIAKFDQNLHPYRKDANHEDAIKVGVPKTPTFAILLKQLAVTFL